MVASINPANGPTIGGTIVTITGTNFGTSNSVVSATIGGVSSMDCVTWASDSTMECVAYTEGCVWTSDSTMECVTPPGVGETNHLIVTVAHQQSSEQVAFQYDSKHACARGLCHFHLFFLQFLVKFPLRVVPVVDTPVADKPGTAGGQITVSGSNFGA